MTKIDMAYILLYSIKMLRVYYLGVQMRPNGGDKNQHEVRIMIAKSYLYWKYP